MIGQYQHSQVAVNPGQQKFSVYKLPNEMSLETSINIIYLSFFSHNVLGCVFMYKMMQKYIQKVSYIQQKMSKKQELENACAYINTMIATIYICIVSKFKPYIYFTNSLKEFENGYASGEK